MANVVDLKQERGTSLNPLKMEERIAQERVMTQFLVPQLVVHKLACGARGVPGLAAVPPVDQTLFNTLHEQ